MFCPRCGQKRVSEETSFCSQCGFLLTGVSELVQAGGVSAPVPNGAKEKGISPRSRGIRKGLFMFLLTFVIAPIVGIVSQFGLGMEPWPVGVVIFALGIGGLLRILYAFMFESKAVLPIGSKNASQSHLKGGPQFDALPDRDAGSQIPVSPAINRLETNDLQPHSVTDHTTKLLEKD